MVKRKKKRQSTMVDDFLPPIGFATGSVTASVLGGAIQPIIPAGITNPLTTAGSTLGKFTGPVSAVAGAGIVLKQVRKIEKKIKKRRK